MSQFDAGAARVCRQNQTPACRIAARRAPVAFSVNLVALFGAAYIAREKYGIVLLYLLLVMGIQGMVMTRDLFNLFVFLEIVSIATYGLLSLRDRPDQEKRAWKALFDYYVFGPADQAGAHLPDHARGDLAPMDETRARRLRAKLLQRLNR